MIELVPLPRSFSLSQWEADLAIGLDRQTHGRLILSRLIDYSLGLSASRSYVERTGLPGQEKDLAAVIGVDDNAYALALDYTAVLADRACRVFRCAGMVGQLESVRAGAGIGVLHDFAASGCPDLMRILPGTAFRRTYWLLTHPDSHQTRRIAACRDSIVRRFREEPARFLPA